MGRLIAVVLFIAVMVPSGLLARGWAQASDRRLVAGGSVELVPPSEAGAAVLARQARHGRRVRQLGFVLGLVLIGISVAMFAEASVFLWLPALVVGLLAGVLLAEATRPRPRWAAGSRRPRRGEQISPWLLWSMRVAVVGELVVAWTLWSAGSLDRGVAVVALVAPGAAWVLAEVALLRVVARPLAAEGADVPVDEALRTWTAHLVCAAASVLALVPLGASLLVAGVDLGDRVTDGVDLVPVALVAGGFSAITAGLAVAFFLVTWLRPVRHAAPALAG
ncbi:hypothetical protein SAMN05660199_01861 [Klenkia soli]|uniref:Uncharacterized protein n=1 Tax=Klenkia soli TaxID=1052260 RepID=A0A1H0J4U7_9ACTN|nr:hypothetical protein [Klenkia soli]SDO38489.1 hypothetical protein SAMN05660199_01861 [Klenkia soli]